MWDKVPETNDSERETFMSRPAVAASQSLPFELVTEDGIPMDNLAHVLQMYLLIDSAHQVMAERGRKDYLAAGNIFVYYSIEQAHDVVQGRSYFRGPDFFFVGGVAPAKRLAWVSWEEGGRLPELIVEFLSPSTAHIDRTTKKDLYSRVFRTPEYYIYDLLGTSVLDGFRLAGDSYRPMRPDRRGRLRSEVLGLDLGIWQGEYENQEGTWIRLFYPDGRMVPTADERADAECQRADAERQRADAERQRADTERQRAEAAEAELARLRSLLGQS